MEKEIKVCSNCKNQKPIDNFQKYQGKYKSWCGACMKERAKAKWKDFKKNSYFQATYLKGNLNPPYHPQNAHDSLSGLPKTLKEINMKSNITVIQYYYCPYCDKPIKDNKFSNSCMKKYVKELYGNKYKGVAFI